MAGGHVLHFGPRKAMGLRLAGPSQGIAKRVFGVDCNGVEAAAELTLVARRNNFLSSGGRFLVLDSLAVVVAAISLRFAFNATLHGWSCLSQDWISCRWFWRSDTLSSAPSERTPENPLIQGTLLGEV